MLKFSLCLDRIGRETFPKLGFCIYISEVLTHKLINVFITTDNPYKTTLNKKSMLLKMIKRHKNRSQVHWSLNIFFDI